MIVDRSLCDNDDSNKDNDFDDDNFDEDSDSKEGMFIDEDLDDKSDGKDKKTPMKVEQRKKRTNESTTNTLASLKKSKIATPRKIGVKKPMQVTSPPRKGKGYGKWQRHNNYQYGSLEGWNARESEYGQWSLGPIGSENGQKDSFDLEEVKRLRARQIFLGMDE
ncbi:unnamed protein product [Dovyalis caffra]|uniref:Uncharacterized protein n=1 Tax=Dovyalis caffra TaxID=77055 RepID=A0AAV1SEQ1_9ROSI|nr:unnamed protein product [Dovyalis caffra]